MNSEVPPISESANSSFEPMESADRQLDELTTENTSEIMTDVWSDEDLDNVVDAVIESESPVELSQKPEVKFSSNVSQSELPEVWAEEETPETFPSVSPETQAESAAVSPMVANSSQLPNPEDLEDLARQPETATTSEPTTEAELFVDSWLDEPQLASAPENNDSESKSAIIPQNNDLKALKQQAATLKNEIAALQTQKDQMLLAQAREVQENLARMVEAGTRELEQRKAILQTEIDKLERRKERINQEMRTNFAGSSQELAVRVQGFKEYLVGSLQDLARAADKLELIRPEVPPSRVRERVRNQDEIDRDRDFPRRRDRGDRGDRGDRNRRERNSSSIAQAPQGQFSEPTFADRSRRIRELIDRYRNNPDYYGSPWQLRRTFEPIHAKRVQDWFFVQGGRGAVDSMGSRLQNILVASAVISILYNLYSDRCRVLVLTDTPENLGEWRRGLQDCLGISRSNFGSNRGITLFDAPEVVIQRAERLLDEKLLPLIIIDETEDLLNLSVLKFPLWLAFASAGKPQSSNYLY